MGIRNPYNALSTIHGLAMDIMPWTYLDLIEIRCKVFRNGMEKSIPVGKDASLLYLSVTSSGNGTQHKKHITHDRKSIHSALRDLVNTHNQIQ